MGLPQALYALLTVMWVGLLRQRPVAYIRIA